MANGLMRMGAALAAGYFLGRTRKGRLILTAAALGMAAKGGVESRQGRLLESPLGSVGKEVAGQLQSAAGQVLTARMDRLSDTLKERSANLRPAEQATEAAGAAAEAVGSGSQDDSGPEEAAADQGAAGGGQESGGQETAATRGRPSQAAQRAPRGRPRSGSTSGR